MILPSHHELWQNRDFWFVAEAALLAVVFTLLTRAIYLALRRAREESDD